MQEVQLYVSHLLDSGCGFGARTDDGEQTFIPASVIKASGAAEGSIVSARLIPNNHPNKAATPWIAVFVAREATEVQAPVTQERSLDDHAYDVVDELGVVMTAEVAKEIGTDVHLAHNALLRLFKAGRVVKADVYARPDQERASFCMWALDTKDFLGEMGND